MTEFCTKFVVSKQKQRDNSNPDLHHHSILARSEEAFDLEILFDPFKKQLYLPPLSLDIRNGSS